MTDLTATLEAFIPQIAATYVGFVTRAFNRATEQFGAAHSGVYNSEGAKFYRETVARFTRREGNRMSDPVNLNTEKLEVAAREYAVAVVAEWEGKIAEKVGEISGEVKYMDGQSFRINGTRNGRTVVIEQSMIVNQSPKGTLFNQFPARIYLDGKFTSAKAYAAAF